MAFGVYEGDLYQTTGPPFNAVPFNPALVESLFTMAALEGRLRGMHQALTPVVDVARDPRWGRLEETFGEDPWLGARDATASCGGMLFNIALNYGGRAEITDALRDRRTLLMMLFLPVVLYPGSLALIGAVTASGQARLAREKAVQAVAKRRGVRPAARLAAFQVPKCRGRLAISRCHDAAGSKPGG